MIVVESVSTLMSVFAQVSVSSDVKVGLIFYYDFKNNSVFLSVDSIGKLNSLQCDVNECVEHLKAYMSDRNLSPVFPNFTLPESVLARIQSVSAEASKSYQKAIDERKAIQTNVENVVE